MPPTDTDAVRAALVRLRGAEGLTLDQLAQVANKLLPDVAPAQPSARVAETLGPRTIRYYLTEGLIDRGSPGAGAAAASRYGYRHLLQLLVLKRLQARGLPNRWIGEQVRHRPNAALERLAWPARRGGSGPSRLDTPAAAAGEAGIRLSRCLRLEVGPGLTLEAAEGAAIPAGRPARARLAARIAEALERVACAGASRSPEEHTGPGGTLRDARRAGAAPLRARRRPRLRVSDATTEE